MSARTGRGRRAVGRALVDTSPLRRHAGFRHLWTGQLVASLGSQLTVVAVGIQTYQLTGSTAMVGWSAWGSLSRCSPGPCSAAHSSWSAPW